MSKSKKLIQLQKDLKKHIELSGGIENVEKGSYIKDNLTYEYTVERPTSDHVYVNLNIVNNTTTMQQATIRFNATNPIIDVPSNYYFSVIRYTIPTGEVPIFVFPNDGLGTQLNTLSVCLTYNNVDYGTTIGTSSPVIYNIISGGSSITPSYFVYTFTDMMNMINEALNVATQTMITANPGLVSTPPYFTYNNTTQLISLNCESRYLSNNVAPIGIYLSTELFLLFDNIIHKKVGNNATNQKDFLMTIQNSGNNYLPTVNPQFYFPAGVKTPVIIPFGASSGPALVPGFFMEQEYSALYNMYSPRNIQLNTVLVPVRKEFIQSTSGIQTSGAPSNRYNSILTDFEFPLSAPFGDRGYIQYSANPYRLIDLEGSNIAFKDMDITIQWGDNVGKVYNMFVPPSDTLSTKFLFLRKGAKLPN